MTSGQRITVMLWSTAVFLASIFSPCHENRAGNYIGLQRRFILNHTNARPGTNPSGGIWMLEMLIISGTALLCFNRLQRPVTMTCIRCGYDLRGSIPAGAATCPECGETITEEQNALQQVTPENGRDPTTAVRDAVTIALCGIAVLSGMLVALNKFPVLTGGPKYYTRSQREAAELAAINKAMKMYAYAEGGTALVPSDVATLVPKYLDAKVFDLRDEPKPPRWSDPRVYCRGRYYFVHYDSFDVESPTEMIMAFAARISNYSRVVIFLDGHYEMIAIEDFPSYLDATFEQLTETNREKDSP